VRGFLAERRWYYLATHPIDVLIVVLPALRPLRVLRVFTAGQALVTQAGRFPPDFVLEQAQTIRLPVAESASPDVHRARSIRRTRTKERRLETLRRRC
jgi:hypothetical protein